MIIVVAYLIFVFSHANHTGTLLYGSLCEMPKVLPRAQQEMTQCQLCSY